MPDELTDFDAVFAEATAEVEGGGGVKAADVEKRPNARVYMGDGEVDDPQADPEGDGNDDDEDSDDLEGDDDSFDDETLDPNEPIAEELDWASNRDKLVTVTINGEKQTLPLSELVNGHLRHSDYTRKTQELAELRKVADWGAQMQRALRENPEDVVRGLAEAFGLKLESPSEQYTTDDPELAPVLSELRETKQALAELQRRAETEAQERINAEVRAELNQMKSTYEDFDAKVVIQLAMERGVSLEDAYFLWKGRQTRSQAAEAREAEAKRVAVEAAKARKRAHASRTNAGAGRKATTPTPEPKFDTIEDMLNYELAKSR